MNIKGRVIGLVILCATANLSIAQTVDLSSVSEFFKIASTLKSGREITAEEWRNFENSSGYRDYAEREDKTRINTIKSCMILAFGNNNNTEKDSIAYIIDTPEADLRNNPAGWLKKHILVNYLDMNDHFESIQSFTENYDFEAYVEKAIQRLSLFLGKPVDTSFVFKTVYFHCMEADGNNASDGVFIDLNWIYTIGEEKRINFLAHEFFHNYREKFENHDFNYKSDLNHIIDAIQNEGIADMVDKSEGYRKYFTDAGTMPDMVEIWVNLYNQSETDLERFQNIVMKFSKNEISEEKMIDEILETVRFFGHPIGFFMANQIVNGGYEKEMLDSFYNPYKFYSLYNKAAKEQHLFQLSKEFMGYLKDLTEKYYH